MIIVHGENTTLDDVRKIPVKTPRRVGPLWRGIPHGVLVDTIIHEVRKREWTIDNMKFAASRKGADLVGAFDIQLPVCKIDGIRLGLAFMTSNAQERALRFYTGGTVEVCNNGLATGQCIMCRKHTYNLEADLEDSIEDAIDDFALSIRRVSMIERNFREQKLGRRQADTIIIETGRRGILPWSRLQQMDDEYKNPPHKEHGEGTCWTMLQSFTNTVKRQPTHTQLSRLFKFRQMMPELVPTLGA